MLIKIMIVDDNPINGMIIKKNIECLYQEVVVDIYQDAQAALDYLLDKDKNSNYQILILDGHLSTNTGQGACINGPEIAKAIQENHIAIHTVVYTNDDDMCRKIGCFFTKAPARLEKQVSKENLKKVIGPILEQIQHEEQNKNTQTAVETFEASSTMSYSLSR